MGYLAVVSRQCFAVFTGSLTDTELRKNIIQ